MIINEMEINKVYFCNECHYTTITNNGSLCPNCKLPLEQIGFVEDDVAKKRTPLGGSTVPGLCRCGQPRASKGIDSQGRRRYRTQCYKCIYQTRLASKDPQCKECGIIPEKKIDLHLDHIDGDRSNNNPDNLQTLCAICHKAKTKRQKDWRKKNG